MTTIEEMTPEELQKACDEAIKKILKRKEYNDRSYQKNRDNILIKHKQHDIEHKNEIVAYKHQHYLDTRDDVLEYERQYYQDHKEEKLDYQHNYLLKHKEEKVAYDRQHRLDHLEERRKKDREYYANNKERLLSYFHTHYQNTRVERLEHQRRYHIENPEVAKTNNARRRARINDAEGTFTSKEFNLKCLLYDWVCAYCGKELPLGPDHVIPLSKGGDNYIENIVPACESCNKSKHNKSLQEFLQVHTQKEQEEILTRIYLADHPKENLESNGN
jgi:5-methylcytosine-specific restriction endonuclease McrA